MRSQRRFRPDQLQNLEARVVLSAAATPAFDAARGLIAQAMVRPNRPVPPFQRIVTTVPALNAARGPIARAVVARPVSPVDKIDSAFDSFKADFALARSLYFSPPAGTPVSAASEQALRDFTALRVDTLAQELVGAMRAPTGSHNQSTTAIAAAGVVTRRINGRTSPDQPGTLGAPLAGTLLKSLLDSIPEPSQLTDDSAPIYILAHDSAIESAQQAVLNAVSYYKLQASQKKK